MYIVMCYGHDSRDSLEASMGDPSMAPAGYGPFETLETAKAWVERSMYQTCGRVYGLILNIKNPSEKIKNSPGTVCHME